MSGTNALSGVLLLDIKADSATTGTVTVELNDGRSFTGKIKFGGGFASVLSITDGGAPDPQPNSPPEPQPDSPPVPTNVPGPPTNLKSTSQTSSAIRLSFDDPTSGSPLDFGLFTARVKGDRDADYSVATKVAYCSPKGGSVTDGFANVWAVTPSSGTAKNVITVNGAASPPTSQVDRVLLVDGTIWQRNSAMNWYSYKPTAKITKPANLAWTAGTKTAPPVTVTGLKADAIYSVTVSASNSSGEGVPTASIDVRSAQTTMPPAGS